MGNILITSAVTQVRSGDSVAVGSFPHCSKLRLAYFSPQPCSPSCQLCHLPDSADGLNLKGRKLSVSDFGVD